MEFSDGGDPLDPQPSYVREVFIKPFLEELYLVTEPYIKYYHVKKKQSNKIKNKLKSSLFGQRPCSFEPKKSALCCLVSCLGSPHHKCGAQEEEEQPQFTTTTEAAVTEMNQEFNNI